MSRQVWKFPVLVADTFVLSMPAGARVLCVQMQGDAPFIWAACDLEAPRVERRFILVGTGHNLPDDAGAHLGTFQIHGGALVFHLFEAKL